MKTPAIVLAMLSFAAAKAAPADVELDFSASIGLPPLSLKDVIGNGTSAPRSLEFRGPFNSPTLLAPKPRLPASKPAPTLPVVEPDPTVDYKMVVVPPDPNIDFKLAVKRVERPDVAKR